MRKFFTANGQPITYDEAGHVAGGNEWFESEPTAVILRALENGDIIEAEVPQSKSRKKLQES